MDPETVAEAQFLERVECGGEGRGVGEKAVAVWGAELDDFTVDDVGGDRIAEDTEAEDLVGELVGVDVVGGPGLTVLVEFLERCLRGIRGGGGRAGSEEDASQKQGGDGGGREDPSWLAHERSLSRG
ncbi:MAG TPA: hypothetical protein QGF05_01480 [Dehalococcoidia bacterium]|nr:hypothetical protein [Dehalococcoidia bacterium]